MPAGETYRYNVVIGIDVVNNSNDPGADIEQAVSRSEKKIKNQVDKVQKHLNSINFDKVNKAIDKIPEHSAKAIEAVNAQMANVNNQMVQNAVSTGQKLVQNTKQTVKARLTEEQRFINEMKKLGLQYQQNTHSGRGVFQGGQFSSLSSNEAIIARNRAQSLMAQRNAPAKELPEDYNYKALASGAQVATTAIGALSAGSIALVAALTAVIVIAAAIVIALVAVTYAAVKLGQKIFELAKGFAEYATEVGKGVSATGLMTETVSGLMHAAERAGVEWNTFVNGMGNFRKTIGEAAGGSKDAQRLLDRLGISGAMALNNIDSATKSAISSIVKMPPGIQQTQAAFAAFGSEGYKLIPFFQSFNGNVDEAIEKSAELGLVLSGKDVEAAKEFNKAYADLNGVIKGIAIMFGREFLPGVTDALRSFGKWLSTNKDEIKSWAIWTGDAVTSVINKFKELVQYLRDHPGIATVVGGVVGGAIGTLASPGIGTMVGGAAGMYGGYTMATMGPSGLSTAGQDFGMGQTTFATKQTTGNKQWDAWIIAYSAQYRIDPALIFAQMGTESSFNPSARSNKGANGLMQIIPSTAKRLGVDNVWDPKQNIEGGIKYMRQLLDMFGQSVPLALAGYNAGEGAVQKYGNKIPPYKETQEYVRRIMGRYTAGGGSMGAGDPAALQAMTDELEKQRQIQIQRARTDWDAAIDGLQTAAQEAASKFGEEFNKMYDQITKAGDQGDLAAFAADVNKLAVAQYDKMRGILGQLESRENQKILKDKGTDNELTPEQEKNIHDMQKRRAEAALKVINDTTKRATDFITTEIRKRFDKEIAAAEEANQRMAENKQNAFQLELMMHDKMLAEGKISDQKYIDWLNNAEMGLLAKKKMDLSGSLAKVQGAINGKAADPDGALAKKRLDLLHQIELIDSQIDQKKFTNLMRMTPLEQRSYDINNALVKFRNEDANAVEVASRRKSVAMEEELTLLQSISNIEDRRATLNENAALRYVQVWSDAMLQVEEADIRANESIIRSNIKMNDAKVLHSTQTKAIVLEHLAAEQTESENLASSIIELYDAAGDAISKSLDKIGIGKIPGIGTFFKGQIKGWLTNVTRGIMDNIFPGMSETLDRQANPMLAEAKDHTKLLKQIAANTGGTPIGMTGPGMSSGSSGGIGGLISTIFGGGNRSTASGGRSSIGTAGFGNFGMAGVGSGNAGWSYNSGWSGGMGGTFSSSGGASGMPNASIDWSKILGQAAPNPVSSALGRGLSSIAGNVAGGGSSVGGGGFSWGKLNTNLFGSQGFGFNSGTIQGIGGMASIAGGLIGGNVGSVVGGVGMGIGMAASLSKLLGITALGGPVGLLIGGAIGGLLALGKILFGRNKLRRQEEQQRTAILVNSKNQLLKLLKDVNADRIDGAQAIDSAESIREEYINQVSQLKDKKTRNIALATVRELDAIIGQIKTAADAQTKRKERLNLLVPTFGDGGSVSNFSRSHGQYMGYITGPGGPKDDVIPAMLSNREYVLDAETTKHIGVDNLDWARKTKGHGMGSLLRMMKYNRLPEKFAGGGEVFVNTVSSSSPSPAPSGISGEPQVKVYNTVVQGPNGPEISTEVWWESPQGLKKLTNALADDVYRQGQDGKLYKSIVDVNKGRQ